MNEQARDVDTAIVGGGLAGLAAAALLARAGRAPVVFEKAPAAGGRAVTHEERGFLFNLGPHALYRGGDGMRVLESLGIRVSGGVPGVSGGYAIAGGRKHALPGGFVSLLTTGLFGLGAKLETARLLGSLPRLDAGRFDRTTVDDFLAREVRTPEVRPLLAALFRLSTYANAPARQSAGVAIRQLQLALRAGVVYLDGGWQTLVDRLRSAAESAGARIRTGAPVEAVVPEGKRVHVKLRGGEWVSARTAILAASPRVARNLLGESAPAALRRFADAAIPVRAACLDVGLSRLPVPRARFALGIDRPLYLSVHSAVARLAPDGGACLHVARYLEEGDDDPRAQEAELERLLDLVQPGWRAAVVARRFLPSMIVSNALAEASAGGIAGRPGPVLADLPGVFLAGDWVGADGNLADASFASARAAATAIVGARPERVAA